jgi:hypothetical protein
VNNSVKEHAKRIRAKVHQIAPQTQMSEFEVEQLRLQKEQLDLLKTNSNQEYDRNNLSKRNEKTKALNVAKKKYDILIEECADVNDVMCKILLIV